MKATVIAVVGSKKSGKTTAIEALTCELVERGYSVVVMKHISEPEFTMDTKGKDTQRFAAAGANMVVAVSPNEVATIEKLKTVNVPLDQIIRKCRGNDVVFVEGFKRLVAENKNIHKIVIVKSVEEALEALKVFKPILAFAGSSSMETLKLGVPYVNVAEKPDRLADLVEKIIKKKLP